MNNLKKLLSVLVVVAMIATIAMPAFAAESYTYTAEAQKLNDLGLYKGISTTTFDPDLGTALNRETGVVMLLRIFGLEAEAEAITDADATLAKFNDADRVSSWAKNAVAYAVKNGLIQGYPDGTFGPRVALNGKQYTTIILRKLGFTPDYNNAPAELADKGGLTPDEATKFASKELIKDDLVGISFGTLSATDKDGKKVIENLVAAKVVDEVAAVDAGLVTPAATPTPAPVASALDVKSASSVTSKYVEVVLNTAAKAEDVTAATFKVADASAKEVAVKSQELAAYDTDSKTVLLTLESDTTAGTLYTLTCGTTSVKFGGKAVDTTKPKVSKIESTDYNEVTVTFTEAVKLDGATFVLAEKYGTKAALTVSNMKYNGKDKIVLSTGDQKAATLYGATITSVVDFSGNTMDKDDAKTFVGTGKSTEDLEVKAAASNNAEEVVLQFNVNVDTTTIAATAFKVEESYGTKAVLTVSAARIATDDDKDTANAALTEATAKKHVILTVPGTKDATLYKVTVSGLKSLYGKALSSTAEKTSKTFVGKAKPTTEMELAASPVTVSSNTSIKITFPRKVDKTLAETVANYAIAEAYGTKAALTVSVAALQDNGTDVKLTVGAMKNVLYKLTITGVKDIYGNAIKTSDSKNVVSYAGIAVGTKIDAINDINRIDAAITSADTQICVVFDQAVGTTATDVSHYTIDNSVGYPEKAATVDGTGNEKKVILTLPKTTAGQIYKLTVKGLENADGVAMDSDGVSKTFVGQGNAAGLPQIEAVLATDDHTIKVYFDRAVDGTSIKGKIYNDSTHALIANRLTYKKSSVATYTDLLTLTPYVYKDDDNANVLVIRDDAASFDTSVSAIFDVKANSSYVDPDNDELSFAGNATDATNPKIESVMALDRNTVMIYFSEPIADYVGATNGIFTINTQENGAGTAIAVSSRVKVDSKTYKLKVADLANVTYYLKATEVAVGDADETISEITDKAGFMELDSTTASGSAADYAAVQFAGTASAASDITDIAVMMTDTRTIEVYYPEAMTNGTPAGVNDASNPDKYKLYSDDGTTLTVVQPKAAIYDSDNKKVKLVLDAGLPTTSSIYYLAIEGGANGVKNATAVIGVKADRTNLVAGAGGNNFTSGVIKQFAISTTDPTKPTIKSVTPSSDNTRLTIEFENAVAFGNSTAATAYQTLAVAVAANEFAVDGSTGAFGTPITFATYFTMTGTAVDSTEVTAPLTAVRTSNTKVELTFAKAFKAGTSGTIKVKAAQLPADTMFTMSKTLVETASDKVQEVSFGISAALGDNTAPVLSSVAYDNTYFNKLTINNGTVGLNTADNANYIAGATNLTAVGIDLTKAAANTDWTAAGIANEDTIKLTATVNGAAVTGTYTVAAAADLANKKVNTVQDLFTAIETTLGLTAGSITTANGLINIDGSTDNKFFKGLKLEVFQGATTTARYAPLNTHLAAFADNTSAKWIVFANFNEPVTLASNNANTVFTYTNVSGGGAPAPVNVASTAAVVTGNSTQVWFAVDTSAPASTDTVAPKASQVTDAATNPAGTTAVAIP